MESWMVEFLIRQSPIIIDDRSLISLVSSILPSFPFHTLFTTTSSSSSSSSSFIIPSNNPNYDQYYYRLSKCVLLRRLFSQSPITSVNTLRIFELIEELDHRSGIPSSPSLQLAYSHVALSLSLLQPSPSLFLFDTTTGDRSVGAGGLVSHDLLQRIHHIHNSLLSGETSVIPAWRTELDADGTVQSYISDAWEHMGPTFLDDMANDISGSHELMDLLGLRANNAHPEQEPATTTTNNDTMTENRVLTELPIVDSQNNVSQDDSRRLRRKHLAEKRTRGAKITDPEEIVNDVLSERYGYLPSPAVDKIQEALKSSTLELNAAVTDPLPESLEIAENAQSLKNKHTGNVEDLENGGDPKRSSTSDANNVRKRSLMTRNPSARSVEWDDSTEDLPEGDIGSGSRIKLPSPKNRVISPLRIHEVKNRKRKNRYITWTALEEETLRTGVKKYGEGCWTIILNSYRDIFETRTAVNLKDKWRNLTK